MKQIIKQVEMENLTENHSKFWTGLLFPDDTVETRWGRIGADTYQSKEFPGVGEIFFDKKVKEKEKKGYQLV